MIEMRFRGALAALDEVGRRALFDRSTACDPGVQRDVAGIIERVRRDGDAALRELAAKFDPAVPEQLEVPRRYLDRALDALDPALRRAMERSAANIATVHRASRPQPSVANPEPGISVLRRPDPLGRVGIYAPGGRAPYPSSVLMAAVPAKIAGVGHVILCSPPTAAGRPADVVLAAAALAGVDAVFALGGAGAIAAMAYGTASVPRVDRIVGPGNAWVAEAKLQVVGAVGIDAPAGPSELLVIVASDASPTVVAAEMIAQAEHDPRAAVVALCVGEATAREVECEIERALGCESASVVARAATVREAFATQGGVLTVASLEDAIGAAAEYAPEHLLLAGAAADLVDRVRNAGTIFVGETSSVAFGDYITGANHVLPTGGLARSYSGLGLADFYRWTTCQRVDARAAASLAADTAIFADGEGLGAHAAAAWQWRNR